MLPETAGSDTDRSAVRTGSAAGGCYRVQVLVVGSQKRWRDEVAAQVRNAGFQATACDRGTDAMAVLALGLPVDVLMVDVALEGGLCCAELAVEARVLRPALRIVLAGESLDVEADAVSGLVPDALVVRRDRIHDGLAARTVREALANRGAPAREQRA
ncbi:histidine kinase [Methylobacterium sp. NEAU 140]|uniref:histidine kinase n=1 Tax=Methylobacterium sp. NEAU 140 TaxID=3064945 RepID=UPI002736E89A|nr:histidine kinase [Methylobacterium sp. NEAU 140]MDP4021440.1 histidine kinase [Methylobacterium sp. NEAU 140]